MTLQVAGLFAEKSTEPPPRKHLTYFGVKRNSSALFTSWRPRFNFNAASKVNRCSWLPDMISWLLASVDNMENHIENSVNFSNMAIEDVRLT